MRYASGRFCQVCLTRTVRQLAHLLAAMPSGRAGWSGVGYRVNRAKRALA